METKPEKIHSVAVEKKNDIVKDDASPKKSTRVDSMHAACQAKSEDTSYIDVCLGLLVAVFFLTRNK